MNFEKILQKPFLISVFVFNIILFGVIVFLLGYVQNLLDNDSRNNLEEIVSQNKNVITSKLLLDLNRLDIISSKISDGLKNKNITQEAELNKFLEDYSKNSIDDSLFLANKDGIAYVEKRIPIDISGRRYFKLAIDGISNISERTISRINGEYIFVGSVPLYYDNKIIGTIQKIYTEKQMNELFAASLFSSKGYMYVINSEGYIILHTKHINCALKSDNYFRDVYEYGNAEAVRKMKEDIKANKSGFMENVVNGEKTFSAYTPIEQVHDWYLVTSVPTDVIAENGNVVMKIFYMVMVALVLIFLVSICYFAWNKRRQKRTLEKIAFVDNVTGGNTYNKFLVDVQELGLKNHVIIVGMDAELAAVKRLVAGTQDATVYMDLKNMASAAVDQAYALAKGEKVTANSEITNDKGEKIQAYLITGEMVTKENIDKVLIESGYYTKEQIYGTN